MRFNFLFMFLFSLVSLMALSACQITRKKDNFRSPHMPVFAGEMTGEETKTNPYWNRYTAYFDKTEIELNTGNTHQANHPSLTGSLGTYYRFPQDLYLYVMTEAAGAQYDLYTWSNGKIGVGALAGFFQNLGAQWIVAQRIGKIFNGKVTLYAAVQRHEIKVKVICVGEPGHSCAGSDEIGRNQINADQDIMNSLIGIEMGRFKIGQYGNTTLNFKIELGVHEVLSSQLRAEDFPSSYDYQTSSLFVATHFGLTLW